MTTYQDVPCLEHGLTDDIAGTMEAIAAVVHEVDSSMTVGEIVCLAYLRGAGDTLSEFKRVIDRHSFIDGSGLEGTDSESYRSGLAALGAMVDRDGRIASMLVHPTRMDRNSCRARLEFPTDPLGRQDA